MSWVSQEEMWEGEEKGLLRSLFLVERSSSHVVMVSGNPTTRELLGSCEGCLHRSGICASEGGGERQESRATSEVSCSGHTSD